MGWLKRLFGFEKAEAPKADISQAPAEYQVAGATIPPERLGLHGEYDQSGLAKRVLAAFDEHPSIDDIDTVYVAQTGSTVVLKGKAPHQEIVDIMIQVAHGTHGATNVDSSQVTIG
ncbi:MAG: BON domain-containing protein [Candidatus Sericytochromatia bacterium]